MITNIIFDLDGTIIDSSKDILESLKKSYRAVGMLLCDKNLFENVVGPPIREIVQKVTPGISDETVQDIAKQFRLIYDNSTYPHTSVYPGTMETLQHLVDRKLNMYIATNKPVKPTERILNKLNIAVFRDFICIDSMEGKRLTKREMVRILIEKWRLEEKNTVMVGDGASDIDAGKYNKIMTMAFTGGYGSESELKESGADLYFNNITLLPRLLDNI